MASQSGLVPVPVSSGAFFPDAHHFTVNGGTFTSNICVHQPTSARSDFRMIRRGDVDLRREIRLDGDSGVAHRSYGTRATARRMFSAKVRGLRSLKSVILYEGENAEEDWSRYVSLYAESWHPNLLQIFGLIRSQNMYAIVTHDDLMSFGEFLALHQPSPVMTVYSHACWNLDLKSCLTYTKSYTNLAMDIPVWTWWIRRTTGRLCVELAPNEIEEPTLDPESTFPIDAELRLGDVHMETMALALLSLPLYHRVCSCSLVRLHEFSNWTGTQVTVGVVAFGLSHGQPENFVKVASLPIAGISFDLDWRLYHIDVGGGIGTEADDSGWTCFHVEDLSVNAILTMSVGATHDTRSLWLSQANHIFRLLQVACRHEEFVLIESAGFQLRFSASSGQDAAEGYLFVCPPQHFWLGGHSFAWPQRIWYWSLDAQGAHPLSDEDALRLGFPSIQLEMHATGVYWDSSVYEGLRTFHTAKGFDAQSQELAMYMGQPLYELCYQQEPLFPHAREQSTSNSADTFHPAADYEDTPSSEPSTIAFC
ncbi:hypothetical protein FB45DRAFT_889409 [Roridomyces roridus]|uniref:Protein kinase domain-containing protein n=1 Tax=Roridomyces roridus TaxID=1738132 RepID=A0AAD7CKI7_9AGAR|nr:hypothetical protein FB45DRAFT_889409 [Roridomyces roridus]